MSVDLLLEKYLLGFKHRGHVWEVYENPSKKEIAEVSRNGNFRFIADEKTDTLYVFGVDIYHSVVWNEQIKVEKKDSRWMYKTSDLFAGSFDRNEVMNWGYDDNYYPNSVIQEWERDIRAGKTMFKFTQKYGIDVDDWFLREFNGENNSDMKYHRAEGFSMPKVHPKLFSMKS